MKVTQYSLKCLKEAFRPEGFNIGINIGAVAGAGMKSMSIFTGAEMGQVTPVHASLGGDKSNT